MAESMVHSLEWKNLVKELSRHFTTNDIDSICFLAREYIPGKDTFNLLCDKIPKMNVSY